MTAEEMRQMSDKTVSELVEIICQLSAVIERQEQELQLRKVEPWKVR